MRISDSTWYLLKRLHSLSGIVPVGLFLLLHLFVNSYALHGPAAYNSGASVLARLPYVQLLELFGIALPILFHMAIGVILVTTGQPNVVRYPHAHNWMYVLQRISGLILVPYLFYHVWSTRLSPAVRAGDEDLFTLMAKQLANGWVLAFSLLGVLAAAWHLGNGLFGFSIHWGLAVGRGAQRRVARLGFAVFLVLAFVSVNSLLAFRHASLRIFERAPRAAVAVPPAVIPDGRLGAR
ncbi:MAG TPA: succinate dehydrogenase [Terriglobales bacterium]|nr:succinate dehydrogenase [Terriglobales bacterium]